MKPPREPLSDDFESDPLWDLLGRAKQTRQASPFFARNIVREIRLSREHTGNGTASLRSLLRHWRLLTSSLMAAGIIALFYGKAVLNESTADLPPLLAQAQFANDLEVIKNLDELLDLENSVWLESTASAY